MATDVLAELDRSLRDFLLSTYTTAVGTDSAGGAFVALQPGGFPLSDEMFRIRPTDPTYSPNKATEEISRKTDLVGQVEEGQFRPVLSSVSELVELAAGSRSAPTASAETAQLLDSLRADASRNLDQSELASFRLGGLPYHPTFASPEAWYDAAAASAWKSMSFAASESETTGPPPVSAAAPLGVARGAPRAAGDHRRPGPVRHLRHHPPDRGSSPSPRTSG